jgi:hypothetical protein
VAGNHPPEVDFEIIPPGVEVGNHVIFMSGVSDPDGDTLQRTWIIDGTRDPELDGVMNWQVDDPPLGEHSIRLVVEDGRGGWAEMTKTLIVAPEGDPENLLLAKLDHEVVVDTRSGLGGYDFSGAGAAPSPEPVGASEPTCTEHFASLDEAYQQYIARYEKLTAAVTEIVIIEPLEISDAQVDVFAARRQYETGDRRAYGEFTAAINRLNDLVSKKAIVDPLELREVQEDYFAAKRCYEEMLAKR